MVTVITRAANGIPLTHDQVDSNFTGLSDAVNNIGADVIAEAVAAKDDAVSAANAAQSNANSAANSANAASISRGNAASSAEGASNSANAAAASAVQSAQYVNSLTDPSGSDRIGNGAETVAQSFAALQLADYDALCSYPGSRRVAYVSGPPGAAGPFEADPNDTTSVGDGGTVFIGVGGLRWKRRFNGGVSSAWFLCDHTGQTDSTAAFQLFSNCLWRAVSGSTPWNGISQGMPVGIVEPGRLRVTGTTTFPTNILLTARGAPANTGSHTRIIMDSTAVTPGGVWQANYQFQQFSTRLPTVANGRYYRASAAGISGATEPIWPTTIGATVVDGGVTWTAFAVTTGDNRNKPIIKWSRASLNGTVLCNAAITSTVQWLEFAYVTPGSTFDLPFSGTGINLGDYPDGGSIMFDVDATDTRLIGNVFQNSPCAMLIKDVPNSSSMRPDGFVGNRGVNLFLQGNEMDTSGAHFVTRNSYIDINQEGTAKFGSPSRLDNCNGRWVQNNGRMYGAPGGVYSTIQARNCNLEIFKMTGVDIQRQGSTQAIDIDRADLVDIDCTFSGATTLGDVHLVLAKGGRVTGIFDNSGYNASAGSGPSDYVGAIRLDGCRGVTASPTIMASATGGAFNGHGVITVSVAGTSNNNVVQLHNITAPYNGPAHDGQDRYVNLQPGDLIGPGVTTGGKFPKQVLRGSGGLSVQGTPIIAGSTYGATQSISLPAFITLDGVYLIYANSYAANNGGLLNTATFMFTYRQAGGSILQTMIGPTNNAGTGQISSASTTITYTFNGSAYIATLSYNRISDGNFI